MYVVLDEIEGFELTRTTRTRRSRVRHEANRRVAIFIHIVHIEAALSVMGVHACRSSKALIVRRQASKQAGKEQAGEEYCYLPDVQAHASCVLSI